MSLPHGAESGTGPERKAGQVRYWMGKQKSRLT
jgi:hypothetical protein